MELFAKELPDDLIRLYATIGSVASVWSHLENSADISIWRLADVEHNHGACLTAHIPSLRSKLLCLLSLMSLKQYSEDLIKQVNKFSGKADVLSRKRNRVVHDPISSEPGKEALAITITADRKPVYGFFGGKLAEYSAIEVEIMVLLREYLKIDLSMREFSEERALSLCAMRVSAPPVQQ